MKICHAPFQTAEPISLGPLSSLCPTDQIAVDSGTTASGWALPSGLMGGALPGVIYGGKGVTPSVLIGDRIELAGSALLLARTGGARSLSWSIESNLIPADTLNPSAARGTLPLLAPAGRSKQHPSEHLRCECTWPSLKGSGSKGDRDGRVELRARDRPQWEDHQGSDRSFC